MEPIVTTDKQMRLVDNVISGKFKTKKAAAVDAGYSPKTINGNGGVKKILESKGVEFYLKRIDKYSRVKFKTGIHNKVMDTYVDGLEATKLFGKEAIEHPDYMARKAFADKFAEFFGWVKAGGPSGGGSQNQFNFFMFKKQERDDFNQEFEGFLKKFYTGQ